jgi:hypothetical protein
VTPTQYYTSGELCNKYREQLERLYGQQVAEQSIVHRVPGTDWFVILVANQDEEDDDLRPAVHSRDEIERAVETLANRPLNGRKIPLSTL